MVNKPPAAVEPCAFNLGYTKKHSANAPAIESSIRDVSPCCQGNIWAREKRSALATAAAAKESAPMQH